LEYGTYDLFVAANVDDRIETVIYDSVREAIVNARVRPNASIGAASTPSSASRGRRQSR
jgi:hypothetical protein